MIKMWNKKKDEPETIGKIVMVQPGDYKLTKWGISWRMWFGQIGIIENLRLHLKLNKGEDVWASEVNWKD